MEEERQSVFTTVVRSLKLLSTLSSSVQEQAAFKFVNPKANSDVEQEGGLNSSSITSYELAVQYNYSTEDKRCLLEVKNLKQIIKAYINDKNSFGNFLFNGK